MPTNDTLYLDLQKQIDAGFTLKEIEQNLRLKGYSGIDITRALAEVKRAFAEAEKEDFARNGRSYGRYLSIVIVAFFGFGYVEYQTGGFIIWTIGVVSLIAAAIYYFKKEE